ncbi:MAG TPA: hypothetical protein VG488_02620 [Candidatus Angelobacter sp.]|nr:hypothetical protein [Candidatus Angelobacter sp.]
MAQSPMPQSRMAQPLSYVAPPPPAVMTYRLNFGITPPPNQNVAA